jgi:hypothetical protein
MHDRRPSAPGSAAAPIIEQIVDDPKHVAAALCQMATLAHASGRLQKRNQSVEVAAELLGRLGRGPGDVGGLVGMERWPC